MGNAFFGNSFGGFSSEMVSQGEGLEEEYSEIIEEVQKILCNKFGLRIYNDKDNLNFKKELTFAADTYLSSYSINNAIIKQHILKSILEQVLGFGPLEPLLNNQEVSKIMVNSFKSIFVEKADKVIPVPQIYFRNNKHLKMCIDKIMHMMGSCVDCLNPIEEVRLPDGIFVNVTVPPASPKSPTMTIRKPGKRILSVEQYIENGSASLGIMEFLRAAVTSKLNILITGASGSGRTTLLNILSSFIPEYERIITIEDYLQLQLNKTNLISLEANKTAQVKFVTVKDLIKNALCMRPDRIVIDEIRDSAVIDVFNAASIGYDGIIAVFNAKSTADCITNKIPILFGMSEEKFSKEASIKLINTAVDLIVQVEKLQDGSRKIVSIVYVGGCDKAGASKMKVNTTTTSCDLDGICISEIFRFEKHGVDEECKIVGEYISIDVHIKEN